MIYLLDSLSCNFLSNVSPLTPILTLTLTLFISYPGEIIFYHPTYNPEVEEDDLTKVLVFSYETGILCFGVDDGVYTPYGEGK